MTINTSFQNNDKSIKEKIDLYFEEQKHSGSTQQQLLHTLAMNNEKNWQIYQDFKKKEFLDAFQKNNLIREGKIIDALRIYHSALGQNPKLDQKLQHISQYIDQFSDHSYYSFFGEHKEMLSYLWNLHQKNRLEAFNCCIDFLFLAENECNDKIRFWSILAGKILLQLDDENFVEEWELGMKDFLDHISPLVENKEKLWIFLAYYFDKNAYLKDKEAFIKTATAIINRPAPQNERITEDNFFKQSYANFELRKEEDLPKPDPDYISYVRKRDRDTGELYTTSDVSSQYRYTEEGVFRKSDHRGRVASCFWTLDQEDDLQDSDLGWDEEKSGEVVGFCTRDKFYPIETYALSLEDDEYQETTELGQEESDDQQSEKALTCQGFPLIPLEYLGKMLLVYAFYDEHTTCITDLIRPLDEHPNHRSNFVDVVSILD